MAENMDNLVELTEQDLADIAKLEDGDKLPVEFHPILKVWHEVLKPAADGMENDPITPMWANKIVSSYQGVTFADMGEVRRRYYEKILELQGVLDYELSLDEQCLTYSTAADDLVFNHVHYVNLVTEWNKTLVKWEIEWDYSDPAAGAELAAIAEVQQMFFGSQNRQGLVQYLDTINFEWGEAEREEMAEAVENFKLDLLRAKGA